MLKPGNGAWGGFRQDWSLIAMQLHRFLGGQEVRDLARRARFNSHRAVNGEGGGFSLQLAVWGSWSGKQIWPSGFMGSHSGAGAVRVAVCGILPRSLVFFSLGSFCLGCGNYKLQRDAFSDSCCSNTRPQGASTISTLIHVCVFRSTDTSISKFSSCTCAASKRRTD